MFSPGQLSTLAPHELRKAIALEPVHSLIKWYRDSTLSSHMLQLGSLKPILELNISLVGRALARTLHPNTLSRSWSLNFHNFLQIQSRSLWELQFISKQLPTKKRPLASPHQISSSSLDLSGHLVFRIASADSSVKVARIKFSFHPSPSSS